MSYSASPRIRSVRAVGLALIAASLPGGPLAAQTPECPDYDDDLGIIWGVVRATEGGVPVPGAAVEVRWSGGSTEAQSLENGMYVVCGVRPDIPVVVQAGVEPFRGAGVPVEVAAGETREVSLNVAFGGIAEIAVTGRIVGRVVDRQTLKPVSDALIGAGEHGFTGVTDGAGRFRLDDVMPGQQTMQVRHLAYGETATPFLMPSDGTLEVEVRLDPAVVPVEPIEVQIVGVRSHKLEMAGFYDRREWNERLGLGHYITRDDIAERGAARVSHVLRDVPRVQMMHGRCFTSRCDFPIIAATNPNCRRPKRDGIETLIGPSLYMDGRRVRQVAGQGIDAFVHPSDIAGIEVYTGTGDLPGEFADFNAQKCGAIVLWTGR